MVKTLAPSSSVRDRIWKMTTHATGFFTTYLPFVEMEPNHDLISEKGDYCFVKEGQVYAIYLKHGKEVSLDLKDNKKTYSIQWFNPRDGGELQKGTKRSLKGGGKQSLGLPPKDINEDWVALVKKK